MRKQHLQEGSGGRGIGAAFLLIVCTAGCGTTRVTDTTRTATEQLLISHSIDNTVSRLDFTLLAGKRVYLDPQYLDGVTDKGYLISSLRQQLLACGCLLQEERKKSTYVVEPRAGSVGTDRNDMLVGVPQMSIPSIMPGIPGAMIPEIALAKKSNRRAVAKIAVFSYNRVTGDPVWQSGTQEAVSSERNSWVCGAGPFQRGSLHKGTEFDEQHFVVPILDSQRPEARSAVVNVTKPAFWQYRPLPDTENTATIANASKQPSGGGESKVIQASQASSSSGAADKAE